MRQLINWLCAVCLVTIMFVSCRDKDAVQDAEILRQYLNLPVKPYDYVGIEIPSFLDKGLIERQDNTNPQNPITNWGASLGRVLFYDVELSMSRSISCASCHQQAFAFSDTAKFSTGHTGLKTKRHSMGLANARYRPSGIFFWDGRAESLEDQVLQPIQDIVEMGLTLPELVERVSNRPYYPILFKNAFGDPTVTEKRIAQALAQFVRSIQSFDSRYDFGRTQTSRDQDFRNFSVAENLGKTLFFDLKKGNCGGCHYTDAFILDIPRNNGLDVWEFAGDKDIGYQGTTGDMLDQGKFIVPSLRNIALRPPYMHDGRFQSLEQVIEHYSSGIQWSTTLDPHLQGSISGTAIKFNLNEAEKAALVAFLKTLSDEGLLTDERYSNPF